MSTSVRSDWWSTFFSGLALDSTRGMFPPEWTRAEADFVIRCAGPTAADPAASSGLPAGSRVLDVPCGPGRVSLELAARGYRVSGIDLAPDSIEAARTEARARGLDARFETRDMRDLPWRGEFHAACCLGNSFAYFDDAGNAAFLRAVREALVPGGKLILHAPLLHEVFLTTFKDRSWHQIGNMIVLRSASYDPSSSRAVTEYTFLRGGETERKAASYRVHSFRELVRLLGEAGFEDVDARGSWDGEPFRFGSRDCYFLATRGGRDVP